MHCARRAAGGGRRAVGGGGCPRKCEVCSGWWEVILAAQAMELSWMASTIIFGPTSSVFLERRGFYYFTQQKLAAGYGCANINAPKV